MCGECARVCEPNAINLNEEPTEIELDVGMVIVTTGFKPYQPSREYGFGRLNDVITQLHLERLLSDNGPTNGKLIKPATGDVPKRIGFITCVGSRQNDAEDPTGNSANTYCSRFCCSTTLKNALLIKNRHPESEIYILYRDIRTFERGNEDLYRRCRENGILFLRYTQDKPPDVAERGNSLLLTVNDSLLNVDIELIVDLLVLVEGMIPQSDVDEVRAKLSITRSADGFFQEAHAKMNPLNTFAEGIFIGGACQGPKDITDSVLQASGAAAKAAIFLKSGKVIIDLVTATVDEEMCTGCARCVNVCPYKAIELNEEERVKVTEVKCKGCGSCAATCPVGAVQLTHYKDPQILAMVETLLSPEVTT
jgi:heterodisulfide reductase subunit A